MERHQPDKHANGDEFRAGNSRGESEVEGELRLMKLMIEKQLWPGSVVEEENEDEE